MKNITYYNIFILISTFARNIVEVFSIILLYKLGFSIKELMLFYVIYFLSSAIVSTVSLIISNKINFKYILLFSSIIYAYSFYYLSNLNNNFLSLFIFAILLSISNYTYHPIRHYYALKVLDNNKNKKIASILIINYIAIIIATYIGSYITDNIGLEPIVYILIIFSLISIIPLFKLKIDNNKYKINLSIKKINKNKILFFSLEQGKVIFLLLQSLYLYIYVKNSIMYLGIFNIINSLASLFTIYFFSKSNNYKFKLINILLCLILILKINMTNSNLLLILAFFEGIGIKVFEVFSTKNIYNIKTKDTISYLILAELIFCLVSSLIFLIFYFINNLKIMLYVCILFIFICSFIKLKIDIDN